MRPNAEVTGLVTCLLTGEWGLMTSDLEECWQILRPRNKGGRGKVADLTGERFGRLVVVKRAGSDKHGTAMWLCKCDCGSYKTVSRSALKGN
jgi:hypothetical protein